MFHSIKYNSLKDRESITVENFRFFENRHGQIGYSFDTPSHRNLIKCGEGVDGNSRCLRFETLETLAISTDEEDGEFPVASITVWIHPETEDEIEQIENITYCVLPKKNGQIVLIIPLEDFLIS